jgi:hypothetical protein
MRRLRTGTRRIPATAALIGVVTTIAWFGCAGGGSLPDPVDTDEPVGDVTEVADASDGGAGDIDVTASPDADGTAHEGDVRVDGGGGEDGEVMPDAVEALVVTLGRYAPNEGFVPLVDGAAMEIVQGPQGGIHLEVAFSLWPANEAPNAVDLVCSTHIEGELEGYVQIVGFPLHVQDDGTSKTSMFFVFFKDNVSDDYIGDQAGVSCDVTVTGEPHAVGASVLLVDEIERSF